MTRIEESEPAYFCHLNPLKRFGVYVEIEQDVGRSCVQGMPFFFGFSQVLVLTPGELESRYPLVMGKRSGR